MKRRAMIAALFVSLILPVSAQGGLLKTWQLTETAKAPVIVVGRILSLRRGERAPAGSVPWEAETWNITAEVEVLRSYTAPDKPLSTGRLSVHYLAYSPSVRAFTNGNPPPLPHLEPGQILILPLVENTNPSADAWNFIGNSGEGLVIPAIPAMTGEEYLRATTPRAFLLREFANTLSYGNRRELFDFSQYVSSQYEESAEEVGPLLASLIGDDRQRWADVATQLLAGTGIPRPTVAELISGQSKRRFFSIRLAEFALQKLKASPQTDELLIRTWMSEASLNAWGVANALIEYAGHPLTTQLLRRAIEDDVQGSSYIASVLVHRGEMSLLPLALARALRVVKRRVSTCKVP